MQINLLNILLGVPSNTAGTSVLADDSGGPNVFAQLLGGDPEFAANDQNANAGAAALLLGERVPSALVAQEVGKQQLSALLNQPVTPEDAAALATDITSLLSEGGLNSDQQQLFEQLKEALEDVSEAGETVELSDIFDTADIDLPDLSTAPKEESSLTRLLAFLQQTFDKKREIALHADADVPTQASLAALSNGLQAITFRTDDRALAAETFATQDAQETSLVTPELKTPTVADVSVIASIVVPAPVVTEITPLANTTELSANELQAILNQQTRGAVDPRIDAAIPSLELTGEDALPVVSLPKVGPLDVAETADLLPANTELNDKATVRTAERKEKLSAHEAWLRSLPSSIVIDKETVQEISANESTAAVPALSPLPDRSKKEFAVPSVAELMQYVDSSKEADHPLTVSYANHTPYTRATPITASVPAYKHIPATPSDQVQIGIRQAVESGTDRITIQLDPADLGRVEIRMDVADNGKTHLVFTADKASTLDALSRGAHGLERSLADAGIKADAGTMEFNLRQQPQFVNADAGQQHQSRQQQPTPEASAATPKILAPETDDLSALPATTQHLTLKISAGVDIEA